MAQGPESKGKRVLKKRATPRKSLGKTSKKERSERAGTFHMKARRDDILGDTPGQSPPAKYVKDAKGVVDFGGEVAIDDAALSAAERRAMLDIVDNEAERAAGRDPENKVLKVSRSGGRTVVHTAKNNLAVAIGKKLHRARKGGELTITWSEHDMPVRVRWTPPRV